MQRARAAAQLTKSAAEVGCRASTSCCSSSLQERLLSWAASGSGGLAGTRSRAAGAEERPLGFIARRQAALEAVPTLSKLLGFAGAIPFLALSPYTLEAVQQAQLVDKCALAQVQYGALICTFLGAVHWGAAMSSTVTLGAPGPAAALLKERYLWSVVPSLAAWPILNMETGPASFAAATLLGICYLSDRSYARLGSIPTWYMTMRGWLSLLAAMGMLSTTAFYLGKDIKKAEERMLREEREAEAAKAAAAEAAAAAAAAAGPAAGPAAPTRPRKGWW